MKKSYENGSVLAINDLSFSVNHGEFLSLMGPSGCEKSTLLNLIGALDTPDEGTIHVFGKSIKDYVPVSKYRATLVGFVFQFHHLIPTLTLLENVELPMYSTNLSAKERKQKAITLLQATGLGHRLHFYSNKVSGGERQRAAIARALVNDPKIILADEPTGSIDSSTGQKVIKFLLEYAGDHGMTVIIVTHNMDIAELTNRTLWMSDGKIID